MIRKWLIYGAMLLFSALYIYTTNSRMAYITLYSFLILPIFSWTIAFVSKYFFKFSEYVDSDFIIKGDEVSYKVILDNKSIFSYSHVSIIFNKDLKSNAKIETDIESKSFSIRGKRKYAVNFKIKCLYRGIFEIGADCIEFKDMLGLIKFKFRINKKVSILVYPQVVELNRFPITLVKLSKVSSNIQMGEEDYTEISDIRKYQQQDGFKKMHWKLSAKKNELLVKSYQASVADSVTVFLDLKRCLSTKNESLIEDRLIESAVALINFLITRRIPVEFNYCSDGYKTQLARSVADFKNIYYECAGLSFSDDDITGRVFCEFISKEIDSKNIILLTSVLDVSLAEGIIRAKSFGHNIFLVFVYDNIPNEYCLLLDSVEKSGAITLLLPEDTNISDLYC